MVRRILFGAAVAVSLTALIGVIVVVRRGGSTEERPAGSRPRPSATTSSTLSDAFRRTAHGPEPTELTTPSGGGAIESSGAAPAEGALLVVPASSSASISVDGDRSCGPVSAGVSTVECQAAAGSGGRFVVALGRHADGTLEALLYRRSDGRYALVAHTKSLSADGDVVNVDLAAVTVGGEPVVVVDYDFDGSGQVHSFDVVAWDPGAGAPRVVAAVGGSGQDAFSESGDALRFVSANYDDGSPTCCPNFADVRTLERRGPGDWKLSSETVPYSQAY